MGPVASCRTSKDVHMIHQLFSASRPPSEKIPIGEDELPVIVRRVLQESGRPRYQELQLLVNLAQLRSLRAEKT